MEIPKLLYQKKFLLRSVLFVIVFSILFMVIYQPFSVTTWFGVTPLRTLFVTLLFYLCAVITLLASKYLMMLAQNRQLLSSRGYLLWVLAEFVLISLIYWYITYHFGMSSSTYSLRLIVKIISCVALILAIPYTLITIYAAYSSKKEELELFKLNHKRENIAPQGRLVRLSDSSGKIKMSVDESSIFYIASQDNYVQIYYELDGRISSYLLRLSTQKMEEYLTDTSIIRCHRSYLVNTKKIVKFRKARGKALITLSSPCNKEISVTPSHYRNLLSHLDSRSL